MPHPIKRGFIRLVIGLAVITSGLAAWIIFFDFTRAAPTLTIGRPSIDNTLRYCANFDFLNNTGLDVNGLHVRLNGVKNIGSTYTGPDNPFGLPDASSGYITATNIYQLNFIGGTVFASDLVHIGLCTDAPVLLLDQQTGLPNFYWTQDGSQVLPNPLFTGLQWDWLTPSNLRIHIVNGQPITFTLNTLTLLDAGVPLALDDLNDAGVGGLPAVQDWLATPQILAPLSDSFFDITFSTNRPSRSPSAAPLLEPNHPYVLQAVLAPEDDPGNSIHLFAQGLSPQIALYLPIITK